MKKATKGLVAAGAGVVLLIGGGGTMAYWTDNQTVPGGALNAGRLNIITDATNTGCGPWTLDAGEAVAGTYVAGDPIVPGDVLTRDCAYTIQAVGNHLRANLTVSSATFTGAAADFGGMLTAAVSGTSVDGTPVTSFTDADHGKTLTTKVTVTFSSAADNTTKDLQTVLGNVVVTATQIHS